MCFKTILQGIARHVQWIPLPVGESSSLLPCPVVPGAPSWDPCPGRSFYTVVAGSHCHEAIDAQCSAQRPGVRCSVAQDRCCVLLLSLFSPSFGHWVWAGPLPPIHAPSQALNFSLSPGALGPRSRSPIAPSLTVRVLGVYLAMVPRDASPNSLVHTSWYRAGTPACHLGSPRRPGDASGVKRYSRQAPAGAASIARYKCMSTASWVPAGTCPLPRVTTLRKDPRVGSPEDTSSPLSSNSIYQPGIPVLPRIQLAYLPLSGFQGATGG